MKRWSLKYFVQGQPAFSPEALIPILQAWIQSHALEGLLLDVADYRHVYQGPGIMLIGHEADYAFDERGGKVGLSYIHKQPYVENWPTAIEQASARLRLACQLLEQEVSLNGLKFNYNIAEITFLDRLKAPNRPEVFEGLKPELQTLAERLYKTAGTQIISRETDPRKTLRVELVAK
jgi:hypothetical protein